MAIDINLNIMGQDASSKLDHVLTALANIQQSLKELKMTDAEIAALLGRVDQTTNKLAANVQTIADVDQKISDEIDAFLKAVPAGTVLTDAQVAQLSGFADRLQATSDASDAQVTVLQAIAAKGQPQVPPPPPPPQIG